MKLYFDRVLPAFRARDKTDNDSNEVHIHIGGLSNAENGQIRTIEAKPTTAEPAYRAICAPESPSQKFS
jgi:hypothetical protein